MAAHSFSRQFLERTGDEMRSNHAGLVANGCKGRGRWGRQALALAATWLILAGTGGGVRSASAGSDLDERQLRRLEQEEILVEIEPDPDGAAGQVHAVIDIAVTPRRLWNVMTDCSAALRFLADLKSCRVLNTAADGRSDVREHIVQWMWPLPAVRSVFESQYTPHRQIAFRRVAGDLGALEGRWRLEAIEQGRKTRLTYEARVAPGWPVPGPLVRMAIEAGIPRTLAALRRAALESR